MKIVQHIPSFFDGWEPLEAQVSDWGAIIALPWIEQTTTLPGWSHWSLTRCYGGWPDKHLLVAEFDQGQKWYVIAKIVANLEELKGLAILPEFGLQQVRGFIKKG